MRTMSPIAVRVARRYVSDVHDVDPPARLALDPADSTERVARE